MITVFATGCGVAVNDGNQNSNAPLVLSGESACVSTALPAIQRYFGGQGDPNDVNASWQCLKSSLQLFTLYVRPANPDYYTQSELRLFLESYVMGTLPLSDTLVSQVFRLKQIVLGGDIDKISRTELSRAQDILTILQSESIALLPHIRILMMIEDPSANITADQLTDASAALARFAETAGSMLNTSGQTYNVQDAQALLLEIDKLYSSLTGWTGPKKFADYLSSFPAFKTFFLRAPGEQVASSEWVELFRSMSRTYAVWLRYHYVIGQQSQVLMGFGLQQLDQVFTDSITVLRSAVDAKTDKIINYAQIEAMVGEIYRLKLLNISITQDTLIAILRPLFGKVFNPASHGVRPDVTGISNQTVDMLQNDMFGFTEMQDLYAKAIDKVTADNISLTYSNVKDIWATLPAVHSGAAQEMQAIFNAKFPLVISPGGALLFQPGVQNLQVAALAFTKLNWQRLAVSLAIRGYAADAASAKMTGFTLNEFHSLYDDFHKLAEDLNILDPRSTTIWKTLNQYSMMFMLSSDGNPTMNLNENVEMISFILSASKVSSGTYKDIYNQCVQISDIDASCFRAAFRSGFNKYFVSSPYLVQAIQGLDDARYTLFEKNLEAASRSGGYSDRPITSADINTATNFLQYIESIMWRFDTDRSGTISVAESRSAYPMFKKTLSDLSHWTDDPSLMALFTYLLKYKEAPKPDIWGGLKFWFWKQSPGSWQYEVDRADMVAILARLSESTSAHP